MPAQQEIRQNITNQIVEALESGVAPWRRPWSSDPCYGSPTNAFSGKAYSGVNPLILQLTAQKHQFTSKYWATFNQWRDLGFQVMKRPDHVKPGGWGSTIVFCKPCSTPSADAPVADDGDEKQNCKTFFMLRSFTVFCADQVSGNGIERFRVGSESVTSSNVETQFERAEQVIEATGAEIRYGGDKAFYSTEHDFIQMPNRDRFSAPKFWETLLHEMCHWTEASSRLNWDRKRPENTYAMGELIAELGSCYLAGELGLPINQTLDNHAAYLKYWLDEMKADSRWIFRATAQGSHAADFILNSSRHEEAVLEEALVA